MDTEKYYVVEMSQEYANCIVQWCYDGGYSFYDHEGEDPTSYMDGTHYVCIDEYGSLIGYFCFGADARIPTVEKNVYDNDFVDIGLGLKPDLCGKGFGFLFIKLGLTFAQKYLGYQKFRLSVAAFNERAVKVYLRAGFCIDREVTNARFKNKFYIMTLAI